VRKVGVRSVGVEKKSVYGAEWVWKWECCRRTSGVNGVERESRVCDGPPTLFGRVGCAGRYLEHPSVAVLASLALTGTFSSDWKSNPHQPYLSVVVASQHFLTLRNNTKSYPWKETNDKTMTHNQTYRAHALLLLLLQLLPGLELATTTATIAFRRRIRALIASSAVSVGTKSR
jgi:hypothetical protein